MMGIRKQSLFVGLVTTFLVVDGAPASGGLIVTAVGSTVRLGFDGFQGDGFAPDPTATQLDSDQWRISGLSDGNATFGGVYTAGDFARGLSTGGVTTGGVYAFDVDPGAGMDGTLGFQPIGSDLTPGAATLMITNGTGMFVNRLELAYQVLVRNDGDRVSSFRFAYSVDDVQYQSIDGLSVNSAEAADDTPSWLQVQRATSLTGLSLADGASIFLRWELDDLSGTGGRDEWAIDNVEFTLGAAESAVPEPSSLVLLSMLGPALLGRRGRRRPV